MIFRTSNKDNQVKFLNSINSKYVEIKEYHKSRSERQNNLYWCLLGIIANETGNTKEALHEYIKKGFLGYEKEAVFGEIVYFAQSTKNLSIEAFNELIEKVYLLADKLNIKLPDYE